MQNELVVVVEDDPFVQQIAVAMFEDAGVPVVAFSNADDALSYLYDHAAHVSAVFTDLQMPGHMDGLVLGEIVGRHWPHVSVLLTSGRVRPFGDLPRNVRFVPKPWSPDIVLSALRRHPEDVAALPR